MCCSKLKIKIYILFKCNECWHKYLHTPMSSVLAQSAAALCCMKLYSNALQNQS
jgi:hypothetical protein